MNRFAFAAALLCLPAIPLAAQTHQDINNAIGVSSSILVSATFTAHGNGDVDVGTMIGGATMTLRLSPHDIRTPGFRLIAADGSLRTPLHPPAPTTYRGTVLENPTDEVAASLLPSGVWGRIVHADGTAHWVQPVSAVFPNMPLAAHVVYAATDVIPVANAGCTMLDGPANTGVLNPWTPDNSVAELGIDADYEYYKDYGKSVSAVTNRISMVVNIMNQQYNSEVGIDHAISTLVVRTSRQQPYKGKRANSLLNKLRNEWLNNTPGPYDMAQLFTGKSLAGSTIGIAWLGSVCTGYGFSLVESDFAGANAAISWATDLSAHECGHNWDADHCSCPSHTMNPYITGANTFNATQTRPEIISHRNSRTCLN